MLSDLNAIKAKSFVKESDLNYFKLGMLVSIYVPAIKKEINAKVSSIIPSADPATHSFVVKYTLEDKKGLIPGMYAKATVVVAKKEAVLVPFAALTTREGIVGVFVVEDGKARFKPVKEIMQKGDYIAVKGLKGGEKVILYPPANLVDGQQL